MLIRHLLEYERTIDEEVVEVYIAGLSLAVIAILDTIEMTVLDVDVIDIAYRVKCNNLYAIL
jgi:hypothetical protein